MTFEWITVTCETLTSGSDRKRYILGGERAFGNAVYFCGEKKPINFFTDTLYTS